MDKLEVVIHNFFKEYAGLESLKNAALLVCRRDGVPLFSYKTFESTWNDSTAGALIGGMWQAAETLTQFIPEVKDEDFRFSFDTSSRGIFIVELSGNFEPLYLSYIYYNLDNPARMKSRVKSIKDKLDMYLDDHLSNVSTRISTQEKEVFLFSDISDDEMDDLFSEVIA